MANDNLSFSWELKGNVEEQIRRAAEDAEKLGKAFEKLKVNSEKVSGEQIQKNITKNVNDAEKALYKLMEAREKAERSLSRNNGLGNVFDSSKVQQSIASLDRVIDRVMNIGAEAAVSSRYVKDLLAQLSSDLVIRDSKSATTSLDKRIDRHIKEQAKAEKDALKDLERAEKEAADAAARNAANQDRVRDALARIATARANLSAANERASQSEQAHIQLLLSLLDRLSGKLSGMRGRDLGEKGALDGILGSGYKGLMRNVNTAIRNIDSIESSITRTPVDLLGGREESLRRIQAVTTEMTNLKQRLRELQAEQEKGIFRPKDVELLQNRYASLRVELENLLAQMRKVGEMSDVYGGIGHLRGYTGPQQSLSDEAWRAAKREAEIREVAIAAAEKHRQKLAELQAAFDRQARAEERAAKSAAQEAAARERSVQNAHKRARASAETERGLRKEAEEVVRLRLEMLKTQAVQLHGLIRNGKNVFDPSQLEQYKNVLREIIQEMSTLKGVMANVGGFTSRELFGFANAGKGTNNASALIAHGQQALEASRAVNVLTDSERKFVDSLSEASTALRGHGMLLNDLRMMLTQYLSLWGAKSFIDKIIETGGLLEQQRLSIGAILGSLDKANVVFSKIKDLAVKSPFGVVELDKMSKQLTAYGFQYEELFDWTKRLADISAATGTEVSRLALALGHVRSEGALSGYTLRQFAMGNVPLLQKLSENLRITTKEVRERTKKKEISYEEVQKVLMDLTNEGGMFYNAQEVMSQALNAKFKNLRDAFDIMYGEIAESGVGDILKGIAEALTAGAKEWKRYGTDLLWVAAAFGIAKTASMAYTAGMKVMMRDMGVLALNTRQYTAAQVQQLATEGQITRAQLLRAVATGRLSVQQAKLAGATLGVSEATLAQAAASGTVNKAMLGNAIATSRYTVAQLRLMATLRAQGSHLVALRVALMGFGNAMKSVGAIIMRFMPFIAIGAVVDFFSRANQQADAAKEMAEETSSAMFASVDNINHLYKSLSKKPPQDIDEMATSVENMKEALKDIGAYSGVEKQVEGTKDLTEQYDILFERLQSISDEYTRMKYTVEAYLEAANNVGGGYFTDNMLKDINQLGQSTITKDVAKGRAEQYGSIYKKELESWLKKENQWVEDTMRNADWTELLEKAGGKFISFFGDSTFDKPRKEWKLYMDATAALVQYGVAFDDVKKKQEEVDKQMPEYNERIKLALDAMAKAKGLDPYYLQLWKPEELQGYLDDLDKVLSTYKIPEETKQNLRKQFIESLLPSEQRKIKLLPPKNLKKDLDEWQKKLNTYFKEHDIEITVSADESIKDVEKRLQEARKKAQERMDSAGAILTKWKIQPDMSDVEEYAKKHPLFAAIIRKAFDDYKESQAEVDRIDTAQTDTGLSVVEQNKTSGSKEDKELKKWRERKKALDEYYKLYTEYARYMSQTEAFELLNKTGLLSGQALPKNISDFLQVLKDFQASIGERNINTTERRALWDSLIGDINSKEFEQKKDVVEAMLKQLDEELKKQGKQWDLYRKIFEATGSKENAAKIAFGDVINFDDQVQQLRAQIEKELDSIPEAKAEGIDRLLGMDAKSLEKVKIFEKSKIVPMLQKLKEAQQQLDSEEVEKLVDALKKLAGVEEQIAVVEGKLNDARQKYGDSDARVLALEKELGKLREKQLEESTEYLRFYGAVLTMTTKEAEAIGGAIKENLVQQLSEGTISADKYLKAIKNVDAQLEKVRQKGQYAKALSTGGVMGWIGAHEEQQSQVVMDKAIAVQKAEEELLRAQQEGDFSHIKAASEALNYARQELEAARGQQKVWQEMRESISKLTSSTVYQVITGMSRAVQTFKQEMESIGEDMDIDPWFDDLTSAIGGIDDGLKSMMNGDIYSGLVKTFTAPITAIAKNHDARIDKQLKKSQMRVKKLTTDYQNLQKAMEKALGGIYTSGGYDDMLENLKSQRDEIQKQYDLESDKKKKNKDALQDYQQQLAELDEQIKDFALDMAKSLYSIDLHSWASELTDSIVSAWEAGEDAAEAYRKKVSDLMKDVVKNILTKKVMERAFDQLGIDKIVENLMVGSNGKLNEGAIPELANALNQAGTTTVDIITKVLDQLYAAGAIERNGGGSSTGSSITSITENTADLLASYVNAIRADVSVNRVTLQQILYALQIQNEMPAIAHAQLTQLELIAGNTRRNADSAAQIYELLKGNTLSSNKFHVA